MNTIVLRFESIDGKVSNADLLYLRVVFWIVFLLLFLLGGALQFIGVLTITETNLLVVSIVAFSLLVSMLFSGLVSHYRWYLWAGLACAYIFMPGYIYSSGWIPALASLMNVLVPLFILQFVFAVKNIFSPEKFLRVLLFISLIQLPIVLLQQFGYEYLINYAAYNVIYLDIGFGTFFLKSDHTMGFFLLCLLLLFLFCPPSSFSRKVRAIYIIWWVVTILLINSKITQGLMILVLASFFIHLVVGRLVFRYCLWSSIVLSVVCFASIIYVNYGALYELYLYIDGRYLQPRWGPVLLAMFEPIKWLGDGPYSYYNPINKEWHLMAGHSYWYNMYYDYGVIGLLLLSSIYVVVTRYASFMRNNRLPFVYWMLISIYGLVVHISIDAPILLLYFVFMLFNFEGSGMNVSESKQNIEVKV